MFLRVVFIIQVFCAFSQTFAVNVSSSASSSFSASPSVATGSPAAAGNITIELDASVFQSMTAANQETSSIAPSTTASSKKATSSNNVQDQLDAAKKLLEDLLNKKPSSGSPSTESPKQECDGLDWYLNMKCSNKQCSEEHIDKVNNLIKCIASKPENVSSLDLAAMIQTSGLLIAEDYMAKVINGTPNNATSTYVRNDFVMVVGVVDDNYINNTKDKFLKLPNYSDPSALTGKWETMRDVIAIPIAELKKRAAPFWPYSWSVHGSLLEDRPLKMTEIETDYNEIIKDSDVSDLYLDGNELKSRKKLRNIFINTNVVSLKLKKSLTDLASPVLITLRHKKVDTLESPACVYWDTINSIWSKKGCKVRKTNSTHTICGCNHLTAFAVAMKEKYTEDLSGRETLVTLAIVFGSISLILLVASAVCVFVVGYHFADNMRIALNLDLALILCQLFFFIGLSDSASKYFATPATCQVIAPFVHMFELAALSFLLMEGLHYVGIFKSVFSKKNTRTLYIYVSLGWGIPVAFGAAVAGYAYQHHGSPIRNEFCWMSVYGADVWYFGAPVLILAILNLVVRAVVLKDVMAWKGNPDDVNIARTKMRLITAIILLPVIILTWLLGVLATNYSEDKVYHYFFVIFHALQGILVFIFYCARNTEMWDYYKNKKVMQKEEKTAVYHFQYVP